MPDTGSETSATPEPAAGSTAASVPLHPLLSEVVACPACHGRLTFSAEQLECAACAVAYPVREGVPVLLIDEATPIGSGKS